MKHLLIYSVILASFLSGCVESQNQFSKLPPGIWRGVLYLNPNPIAHSGDKDEVTTELDNSEQLPFNFEVVYDTEDDFHIEIHNASEKIKVDNIIYGRDRATAKDTLSIHFPIYDSKISAIYEEKVMEGYWHVNYKTNYKIKFKAVHGDTLRFKKGIKKAGMDVTGKWDVKFEPGTDDEYPAIGVFTQQGDYLEGTFQTETGDYRYLEGRVADDKMFLSCFDGAHAFLFEAKDLGDGKLNGSFKSGIHYTSSYTAERNYNAVLGNPFDLNEATQPSVPMEFSFPNESGKTITLSDESYQDKPKIVEIMGTWCPNCKDATNFLKEFKTTPAGKDVEVISIAFERYKEDKDNLAQLARYKKASEVTWEVVLGGYYNKRDASKIMTQIDRVISYPTMIFLDKDNYIKHIHTGFSGPATREYDTFKTQFNEIIKEL